MEIERLLALFVDCSICIGYGHASGRSHLVNEVSGDLEKIYSEIATLGASELFRMESLMAPRESPWVRYHAAVSLLGHVPAKAIATLEELSNGDALVKPLAWLQLSRVLGQR